MGLSSVMEVFAKLGVEVASSVPRASDVAVGEAHTKHEAEERFDEIAVDGMSKRLPYSL
jgi:hypothetical protein